VVEALLLPSTMRYNMSTTSEGIALIGQSLDLPGTQFGEGIQKTIGHIEIMLKDLGVPSRLRDIEIARDSIPAIVDHALDDWALTRVPRAAGRLELEMILDNAW
jgi:alcohol dehydrogenase class IV